MKKLIIYAIMIAVLALAVFANPNAAEVEINETSTYNHTISAGEVTAQGGNVTAINLTTNSTTLNWQGFYGNVSGNLVLGDSSGNIMYDWAITTVIGRIFATTGTTPTWATVNSTDVTPADLDANLSITGADAAASTYTDNNNTAFDIGSVTVAANSRPALITNAGFENILLGVGTGPALTDFVFAGILQNAGTAFNSETVNFELMVPVSTKGGTETYYFYLELE